MSQEKNEKNLGGKMDSDLVDQFTDQVDKRSGKIKRSLAAAIKLWIALPGDIQARLLNQSLSANSFIELVQEIVDKRIQNGRNAARKLLGPQRKKRGRKD